MKKLAFAVLVAVSLGTVVYAACTGPYCWDDTGAQINAAVGLAQFSNVTTSTPTLSGVMGFDSNYRLYVATCTSVFTCWSKVGAQ